MPNDNTSRAEAEPLIRLSTTTRTSTGSCEQIVILFQAYYCSHYTCILGNVPRKQLVVAALCGDNILKYVR